MARPSLSLMLVVHVAVGPYTLGERWLGRSRNRPMECSAASHVDSERTRLRTWTPVGASVGLAPLSDSPHPEPSPAPHCQSDDRRRRVRHRLGGRAATPPHTPTRQAFHSRVQASAGTTSAGARLNRHFFFYSNINEAHKFQGANWGANGGRHGATSSDGQR
jgi:hypothetical protein